LASQHSLPISLTPQTKSKYFGEKRKANKVGLVARLGGFYAAGRATEVSADAVSQALLF